MKTDSHKTDSHENRFTWKQIHMKTDSHENKYTENNISKPNVTNDKDRNNEEN